MLTKLLFKIFKIKCPYCKCYYGMDINEKIEPNNLDFLKTTKVTQSQKKIRKIN